MILADDHLMVAEALGRLIAEVADLVGRAADGQQLVESARRLKPDIIVSDITMPVMSGLDALRQLKSEQSSARFIFLTVHTEASVAAEAMRAGACGYLLKAAAGEELLDAIRAVMAGRIYLTPHIAGDVLRTISQPADHGEHHLTSRQREILGLIAQGKRMKEIAGDLKISVRTVEDHKSQLLHVLGAKRTADLIRFAVKQGLISD
ncbi:DNA-binding response regulator [Mesorhizobium waimense]|uniref:DNA-binding response regulator n=1 Tax=Mesorhizobium waimense TaxID=1300307 RepID=A0A3A5JWG8_9HYPH|nr:response regulator transcription factor [Mesorhizobium waimense]RJT26613.1 DNA-binding response regulator [Mesorhizobium waimense]